MRSLVLSPATAGLCVALLATAAHTQAPGTDLERLAGGWSGGERAPACRAADRAEDWGAAPGSQYCEWPASAAPHDSGRVWGRRDADGHLFSLFWERAVPHERAARILGDSLGRELRGQGLREYACPDGGRRWQAAGLAVQFSPGATMATGMVRVMVAATTLPNALPGWSCPAAPAPAPGSRRAAT